MEKIFLSFSKFCEVLQNLWDQVLRNTSKLPESLYSYSPETKDTDNS